MHNNGVTYDAAADDVGFELLFIEEKISDNVDISLTAPPLTQ